jgi:CHAT domain-containing protein
LLKLTELQDYFGDECIQVQDLKNAEARPSNTSTATIYSIILADKAYTILRLTNGELKSYPVTMKARELDAKILQFRTALEDVATNDYWALSNELYDLLIRPAEGELAAANPKALVFVNDGLLRNVPMAALHDGKQFLVEKYPIAVSLGFNLSFPQRMQQKNQALIFGLTVEIGPFAPLPSVATETQRVQEIVGGSRFLDSEFTLSNLQKQLQARTYPILHLATHGKFGATADTTFLQAFDTRVTLQQFEKLLANLKQPVDLLTLSACQTAAGDNRSTLGLAGVAVRNGIKNVLASLWSVNDAETVELVEKFYNYLRQPAMSPADSLRRAQLELIANFRSHPANWSSFILIGDNL